MVEERKGGNINRDFNSYGCDRKKYVPRETSTKAIKIAITLRTAQLLVIKYPSGLWLTTYLFPFFSFI